MDINLWLCVQAAFAEHKASREAGAADRGLTQSRLLSSMQPANDAGVTSSVRCDSSGRLSRHAASVPGDEVVSKQQPAASAGALEILVSPSEMLTMRASRLTPLSPPTAG